jgi:hypothetical protein
MIPEHSPGEIGSTRRRLAAQLVASAIATTTTIAITLGFTREARAQDYAFAASVSVAGGVEGGGRGYAAGVRRAPTALRIGGEARLPEMPRSIFEVGLLIGFEPEASVGVDLRYAHLFGKHLSLHIGGEAVIAPSTLFGATAGAEAIFPLRHSVDLFAGPSVTAFFFGNDLPDGNVLWQGLVHLGIHVDLD